MEERAEVAAVALGLRWFALILLQRDGLIVISPSQALSMAAAAPGAGVPECRSATIN